VRSDRPSHTAIKIARGMSFLGRTPPYAELLPPGAAEWTERLALAAGILRPWMIRLYGSGLFGAISRASDRRVMPGQLLGSTLRKRFVDDRVREAIDGGAAQVLVVGAGFDTLALRLAPEHRHITYRRAHSAASISTTARTSPAVVDRPRDRRTVPSASRAPTPMAVMTAEAVSSPS